MQKPIEMSSKVRKQLLRYLSAPKKLDVLFSTDRKGTIPVYKDVDWEN